MDNKIDLIAGLIDEVDNVISELQDSNTEVALDNLFAMRDNLQEMLSTYEVDTSWTDEERELLGEEGLRILEDTE